MMSATTSVTAILVSDNIKVLDVDGAWVELSVTEMLEKLYSNAVDSKKESHTTSPAQLTSEQLIARDTLATGQHNNALRVMMVNSQML